MTENVTLLISFAIILSVCVCEHLCPVNLNNKGEDNE